MKCHLNTSSRSLILLPILCTSTIHINKYILSVLGFTYPTVFQGWHTLVAVLLMRVLLVDNLTPLSWNSFYVHLPLFVCFVGAIVAGSKALSSLPVPIIICAPNVILALKTFFDTLHSEVKSYSSMAGCFLCLISTIGIFLVDPLLSEMSSGSVWLLAHIFFLGAQSITDQDSASGLNPIDKFFYCNLFSVVVLAPSSFYLEEAFEALHFQERRQLGFLIGCVISSVFGTLVSILLLNSTAGFFSIVAISKATSCVLSPFIIPCFLNFSTWILITVNLMALFLIRVDMSDMLNGMKTKQLELV